MPRAPEKQQCRPSLGSGLLCGACAFVHAQRCLCRVPDTNEPRVLLLTVSRKAPRCVTAARPSRFRQSPGIIDEATFRLSPPEPRADGVDAVRIAVREGVGLFSKRPG